MKIHPDAPRIPAPPPSSSAPAAAPAEPHASRGLSDAAPAGYVQAAAPNGLAGNRGLASSDTARQQGVALQESRRAARAERVSNTSGGELSVRDRVHGLLDVLKGVGPASAQVQQAFRQMLDGKALGLPDWQGQVRRTLLGPPYPTTPQAIAAENQRIGAAVAGPLAKPPPQKAELIEQLHGLGLSNVDIFRGSHTLVNDGGALYDEWKSFGARPRTSSHYPGLPTQQQEIEFPGIGVMLFGKDRDNQTWFQMEAHSTRLEELIPHMLDYVRHQISGHQNIGPMGYSPHSEKLGQELRAAYAPQPALG